MVKRKIMLKYNRQFTDTPNYYSFGGDFVRLLRNSFGSLKSDFNGSNIAKKLINSDVGNVIGDITGNVIGGGLKSNAGNAIDSIGNTAGNILGTINPILGGAVSAGTGIIGGIVNKLVGSQLNEKKIAEIENSNKAINNVVVDNSNIESIMNLWSNQDFGKDFSRSDVGKDGLFSNKAKNKYKELKLNLDISRNRALTSYENALNTFDSQLDFNILSRVAAYGGPLTMRYTGAMSSFGNTFANGGNMNNPIKKKSKLNSTLVSLFGEKDALELTNEYNELKKELQEPPKKGSFGGGSMSGSGVGGRFDTVQDYSSFGTFNEAFDKAYENKETMFKYGLKYYNTRKEINPIREINNRLVGEDTSRSELKAKDSYEYEIGPISYQGLLNVPIVEDSFPLTISDWYLLNSSNKKAFGGNLLTNGAVWDNGVTIIGNGGTHEENPMEGVPMGVDEQGIPNLVEEGEVIFNDYVFSNRLSPTKEMKKKYKYKGDTFADIAKNLQKESEERPNDPISKRGLLDSMLKLLNLQEIIRQDNETIGLTNKFDTGGHKLNSYSLRNSNKFIIDRTGFKFPVPRNLSNINDNYNIDKDIEGNLIPSINNSTFGYSNWDDFRVDSLALEKDLSRRLSRYLYNFIKNNLFGLNSKYPFRKKNSVLNFILKVFDLLYPDKPFINKNNNTKLYLVTDLPTVDITPRKNKNNNTKLVNIDSKVPRSNNTLSIPKKILTYKNNKLYDKPISIKVPYFSVNRIEPLGIDESWNNIKDKSLFLYPENISFLKYEYPIFPINSKISRDIQLIPLSKLTLLEIPYNNENNNFMRDYLDDLVELKRNLELTGLKSNTSLSPSLEEFNLYNKEQNIKGDNKKSFDLTNLRYAPVVGAAIGLGQNLFSKPDYSSANAILEASNQIGNYNPVVFNPIGDYLAYNPFDRDFYLNKLNAQSGATRRAIVNQSAGNRATALAGLLAADYNAQSKLGDLARQAEEYNLGQRERVASFNRGTNQFNSEMGLKAAMANQEAALRAKSSRLSGITQAMQIKDAVDARRGASMSANLSNFFTSLGNIGIDAHNRKDRDFYIKNVAPNLPLSEIERLYGREAVNKAAKDRGISLERLKELGFYSKGGRLNIKNKKRKGFTF